MIETAAQKKEAYSFYAEALNELNESEIPYLVAGAFAMFNYTGIYRDTKDLDIFCKPSDYPFILKKLEEKGYKVELTDARWLAKAFRGDYFIDIIFNSVNNIWHIDDTWFERSPSGDFSGVEVRFIPPEELVWSKIYVQNRERFDGADINHILLKYGHNLDWKRIANWLEPHWHILLAQLLQFQFVYPSEYQNIVPRWLFDELLDRARLQYELPSPQEKVCLGPVIDQTQYCVDIKEWNYKSLTIKTT